MDWHSIVELTALILLTVVVWAIGAVCIKAADLVQAPRAASGRDPGELSLTRSNKA